MSKKIFGILFVSVVLLLTLGVLSKHNSSKVLSAKDKKSNSRQTSVANPRLQITLTPSPSVSLSPTPTLEDAAQDDFETQISEDTTDIASLSTSLKITITPAPPVEIKEKGWVKGKVMIGPTCPGPVRDDSSCPDKPYQTNIVIKNSDSEVVSRISSDSNGEFLVELLPGTYTITAGPSSDSDLTAVKYPSNSSQTVTVSGEKITEVLFSLDSRIR